MSAFGGVQPPALNDVWKRLDAGDVVIYSNARDGVIRQSALELVRMRAALTQVTRLQVVSPVPTKVFLFRTNASFVPYRDAIVGKFENLHGIFTPGDEVNYALVDASVSRDDTLFHELTHFFVRNTVAGIPRWLDEGLAGFYESFAAPGNSVRVGAPPDYYLRYLRAHRLEPLRKILTMTLDASHLKNEDLTSIYYAETWLLTHYLLIGNPARGAQLPALLGALDEGKPLDVAFAIAFKATPEEIEGEIRRYLGGSRFSYMDYKLENLGGVKDLPAPQVVPRDELLFQLGNLLVHTTEKEGGELLEAAIELNPDRAAALADLAAIAEAGDRRDVADDLYDRAIKLAGNDFVPYLYYARSLATQLQKKARDGEDVSGATIAVARRMATKCTDLAPQFARCRGIAGATYALPGEDAAAGIALSAKSLAAQPSQLDVAADLVLLYAKLGQRRTAEATIARFIAPSADAQRIAEARENLAIADYQRGVEHQRAGKPKEATAALEAAIAQTTNPKLKANASKALATLANEAPK
jgi:tetratricopeptide (TPR) repeat protein